MNCQLFLLSSVPFSLSLSLSFFFLHTTRKSSNFCGISFWSIGSNPIVTLLFIARFSYSVDGRDLIDWFWRVTENVLAIRKKKKIHARSITRPFASRVSPSPYFYVIELGLFWNRETLCTKFNLIRNYRSKV